MRLPPAPLPSSFRLRTWLLHLQAGALGVGLALLGMSSPLQAQSSSEASALRLGFPAGASAPFVVSDGRGVQGGLNLDLADLLAETFGRPIRVLTLPANRLDAAVEAGELDLRCHAHPDSVPQPNAYSWSAPLWAAPEVLVGPAHSAPLAQLSEVQAGQVIGTVLHRSYPGLDAQFGTGNWRRDDAPNTHRALSKMALGRGHYAITTVFELRTYKQEFPEAQLAPWRLYLGPNWLHCAVPHSGRLDATQAIQKINRLQEDGRLGAVLQRYRLPRVAVVAGPRSRLSALDREQLEAWFTPRPALAAQRPRPLVLHDASVGSLAEQVMGWSEAQLRAEWVGTNGWARRVVTLKHPSQVKQWLRTHPQAVAVLPLEEVDSSLRVLYLP